MTNANSNSGTEGDYLLGTHDAELERLGLQHRVWRPFVLDCWRRAGIMAGSRVLDVGAGPGFATLDLAETVGPAGHVVALERSSRYVEAGRKAAAGRSLSNVAIHELDLMTGEIPGEQFDAAWCRWVAAFVSSPQMLVEKLTCALRHGGVAIFHEYLAYETYQLVPRSQFFGEFVAHVTRTWRESGGEPNVAPALVQLLAANGFTIRETTPRVFCARPSEDMWNWGASFVRVHLERMRDMGGVDLAWIDAVRLEFDMAESRLESRLVTPLVLEIVAERS